MAGKTVGRFKDAEAEERFGVISKMVWSTGSCTGLGCLLYCMSRASFKVFVLSEKSVNVQFVSGEQDLAKQDI